MTQSQELSTIAKSIIDSSLYGCISAFWPMRLNSGLILLPGGAHVHARHRSEGSVDGQSRSEH